MNSVGKLIGLAITAAIAMAAQASATIVTFDVASPVLMSTYSESGVNLSINSGSMNVGFVFPAPGNKTLYFGDNGGNTVTVDMGGGAFDLISMDVIHQHAGEIITASNGATAVLPQFPFDVYTPYLFSAAFMNITWFTIFTPTHLVMDNLNLAASVSTPVPAGILLLGAGLAGLGIVGRRQRRGARI